MKEIKNLKPFTRFLMTIGELPSSYLVSMTYEEQLLWFCNYLQNTVIPTVNNNAEAVIELQNYVANYFNNLDVQDEIDNKLDEMAESGELTNIIAEYLTIGTVLSFNTVAEMVASKSLVEGSTVRTLGRTSLNDLKGAFYKIVKIESGVEDGINIISLDRDDLYAQLIYENKITVINTLADLKSSTNVTKYDYYKTLGYNSINDGGNGIYYIVDTLDDDESANNGNIVALQNNLYAKLIIDNIINIKQFGAVGDNDTDDTTAIQNAINYSANNYYKKIFVPEGVYKITSTISTPQAFNQPIISGENAETCMFNFSTSTSDCLKIKGGSGRLARSYIENITFIGNSSTDKSCIVLADVCGYDVINCRFTSCRRGILFYNESANAFTECCVARNCSFEDSCHIAVEYSVESGNDSFHGSGIDNCTIQQDGSETYYKIIINNNCLVYNAPLDFTCWKNNTSLALINNLSVTNNMRQTFYGNIRIEMNTASDQWILKSGDSNLYYCGDVMVLGGYPRLENITFCEKVEVRPDRSLSMQRKPYMKNMTLSQASTNILSLNQREACIAHLKFEAPFYIYQYTLLLNCRQSDSTVVISQLLNGEAFNQAGYGGITFSANGNNLVATNSNFANVNCGLRIDVTPLSLDI